MNKKTKNLIALTSFSLLALFSVNSVSANKGEGEYHNGDVLSDVSIDFSDDSDFFSDDDDITAVKAVKSVELAKDRTSIANGEFEGCTNLESITIPEGVTSIGDRAFKGCKNLKSITLPNSLTSIGYWVSCF